MDLQADIAEDASSGVNRHMPSDFDCGPINLGKTQLSHSLGLGCNLPPALHPNPTLALNSTLPYGANSLMGPGTASRCGRRKDSTPHALLPGRVSLVSLHPQLSWTRVCSLQCHASFGTAMPGLPGAARSLWRGSPNPVVWLPLCRQRREPRCCRRPSLPASLPSPLSTSQAPPPHPSHTPSSVSMLVSQRTRRDTGVLSTPGPWHQHQVCPSHQEVPLIPS